MTGVLVALLKQRFTFLLRILEVLMQQRSVGVFEIETRILLLGLQKDVAIGETARIGAAVEVQVVDTVDALNVHGKPL